MKRGADAAHKGGIRAAAVLVLVVMVVIVAGSSGNVIVVGAVEVAIEEGERAAFLF